MAARGTAGVDNDWDLLAVLPDDAPEAHLDLAFVWKSLRDLRLQRVDVCPVRRSEFEEARNVIGTLAQIATAEGIRVRVA